jgi:hypothetical protein
MLTAKSALLDQHMKNHTTGLNAEQSSIPFEISPAPDLISRLGGADQNVGSYIPRNGKEVAVPGAAGEHLIGAEIASLYRWFGMRATN